jgi:hypothetical protein
VPSCALRTIANVARPRPGNSKDRTDFFIRTPLVQPTPNTAGGSPSLKNGPPALLFGHGSSVTFGNNRFEARKLSMQGMQFGRL